MKHPLYLSALIALTVSSHADPLQDDLDKRKADFESKATPEKIEENEKGIEAVRASGVLEKALKEGDTAPNFTLKNGKGEDVSLDELLEDGTVVLMWYRGSWCSYCNIAIQAYQEHLDEIKAAGGQLVALTPELPDKSMPTIEKYDLGYEVLTDLNNGVAEKFGTVFQLAPKVAEATEERVGLRNFNGADYDKGTLPLSATYIITPDRKIAYAFLDADYRRRAEPTTIVAELEKLKTAE
ncbi:MAG: peroxiredoxin-like family protein [Luteolibacter sp.]